MKKTPILLLAAILTAVSCDLTTVPEDSMTPDLYFSSAPSLEQWLNNCYTQLEGYSIIEMEADDAVDLSPTAFFARTISPFTESWSWTMLRRINYFLEHADLCDDKDAVAQYSALARFHRAYFYFDKVRKYGDIMWYDQVIGSTDEDLLYKPRDDRGYVVDRIIDDLDAAAEGLPAGNNDLSTEINRWTALAFKARVCLFEGTFRKYHGQEDADWYLEQCTDACRKVMDSGKYSLYNEGETPYQDLFCMDHAPSCEAILAHAYNKTLGSLYHSLVRDFLSTRIGLTQRFVNHYLMKDGTPVSSQTGYARWTFQQVFKDRDPRMAQTVWGPGVVDYTGHTLTQAYNLTSITGYFPVKFAVDVSNNTNRDEDIMLIRYAEVLLAYAEAKAELGTLTAEDIRLSINPIRARAGLPDLDLSKANASPDPLLLEYYPQVAAKNSKNVGIILEIRRERTVELVMEGHRQWDLIRWAEGAAIDNTKNPFYGVWFSGPGVYDLDGDGKYDVELYRKGGQKSGKVSTAYQLGEEVFLSDGDDANPYGNIVAYKENVYPFKEERDYLRPIPATQRALCGGILTQNPGWEDGLDF